jgi:hypothetical protein
VLLLLQVLQEMLDMLRDHQQNHHSARLEWIIIWLIAGAWWNMGFCGSVSSSCVHDGLHGSTLRHRHVACRSNCNGFASAVCFTRACLLGFSPPCVYLLLRVWTLFLCCFPNLLFLLCDPPSGVRCVSHSCVAAVHS